ncbi:hypothetical protein QVA66_06765 [Staphylococcus chromogenes]|nr:hypothetical protein [Staphylococcus chromogenes]
MTVAASCCALTACAEQRNSDATWQITEVHTDPAKPGGLPQDVSAVMVLGTKTVTGDTGCAPFQGKVEFDKLDQPTKATFSKVRYKVTDCVGAGRYFHDALVTLLDGEFAVKKSDTELLLTKEPAGLDAPSIRLVATR